MDLPGIRSRLRGLHDSSGDSMTTNRFPDYDRDGAIGFGGTPHAGQPDQYRRDQHRQPNIDDRMDDYDDDRGCEPEYMNGEDEAEEDGGMDRSFQSGCSDHQQRNQYASQRGKQHPDQRGNQYSDHHGNQYGDQRGNQFPDQQRHQYSQSQLYPNLNHENVLYPRLPCDEQEPVNRLGGFRTGNHDSSFSSSTSSASDPANRMGPGQYRTKNVSDNNNSPPSSKVLPHQFTPARMYQDTEHYDWWKLLLLLLFVIGFLVSAVYFMGWLNPLVDSSGTVAMENKWIAAMRSLHSNHSHQPLQTYNLVTSAGRRLIKWGGDGARSGAGRDRSPAMFKPACVVTMFDAADRAASPTADCFVQKVSRLYKSVQLAAGKGGGKVDQLARIHSSDFSQSSVTVDQSAEMLKLKFDVEVRRLLREPLSGGVLLIKEIDKLSPEVALTLHTHCDENPPVTNTLIFMTVAVPKDVGLMNMPYHGWLGAMEAHLNRVWSRGIVADKIGAIFARIGDYVTVVVPDSSLKCG